MNKYLRNLAKYLVSIKDIKEMENFLTAIFTPAELEHVPKRLELVRLLKQGVPQHEIAKQLGMGVATVTRGSQELKKNNFKNV
ncbi:MAG: transcriptional regulator [Candidatus Komeilibacteria bacterium]|jgi:TrpR family transcriptional regulator, trp operon repressor|nr:transcriptional regulator [Candidatus Komeilibacteria bacterium]MBT4447201.1 transcriptional regulator [Candidatus Komeilibacteria bacterium]